MICASAFVLFLILGTTSGSLDSVLVCTTDESESASSCFASCHFLIAEEMLCPRTDTAGLWKPEVIQINSLWLVIGHPGRADDGVVRWGQQEPRGGFTVDRGAAHHCQGVVS